MLTFVEATPTTPAVPSEDMANGSGGDETKGYVQTASKWSQTLPRRRNGSFRETTYNTN